MQNILHEKRNPVQEIWNGISGKEVFKGNVKQTVAKDPTAGEE